MVIMASWTSSGLFVAVLLIGVVWSHPTIQRVRGHQYNVKRENDPIGEPSVPPHGKEKVVPPANRRWTTRREHDSLRESLHRLLSQTSETRSKRSSVHEFNTEWPQNVPYELDPNYTPAFKDTILEAIDYFNSLTCVQFVPRNGEADYLFFQLTNRLCYSYIGKNGGKQILHLGEECPIGTILHELMHALGFIHEQTRPDRDRVLDVSGDLDNSYHMILGTMDDPNDSYDLSSIMHYGLSSQMQVRPEYQGAKVGGWKNNKELMFSDIRRVMTLYNCVPSGCSQTCENHGFLDQNCQCRCPEFFTGATCQNIVTSCGEIRTLTAGEEYTIHSSNNPVGSNGLDCVWFFKTDANSRIKATLNSVNIDCETSQLMIKHDLVQQKFPDQCQSTDFKPEYITTLNGQADSMLIYFGADYRTTSTYDITVRPFLSGCLSNPCLDGSPCIDNQDGTYVCQCFLGYSGADCSVVTATSTVTSRFESNLETNSFLHQVKGDNYLGYDLFHMVHYNDFWGIIAPEQNFMLVQKSDGEPAHLSTSGGNSISALQSWLTFEAAPRCLQMKYNVRYHTSAYKANIIVGYYQTDGTFTEVFNFQEGHEVKIDTNSTWQQLEVDIPSIQNLQVEIRCFYGYAFASIDDVVLKAGTCGSTIQCQSTEYYDTVNLMCRPRASNTESCPLGIECQTGLLCTNGQCGCSSDKYWDGTTCQLLKSDGTSCGSGEECLSTYCDGTCTCPTGQYWTGSVCENQVGNGFSCSSNSACQTGLICISGTCQCNADQYWDSVCKPKKSEGAVCGSGDECLSPLLCNGESCTCPSGQYWDGTSCVQTTCDEATEYFDPVTSQCKPRVGHGGSCSGPYVLCQSEFTCINDVCNCDITEYYYNGACYPLVGYMGTCQIADACQAEYVCQNNLCQCATDEYHSSGTCYPKESQGGACGTDGNCLSNLACLSDTCSCTAGLEWNTQQQMCITPTGSGSVFDCTFEVGQSCPLNIAGNYRIYPDGGVTVYVPHEPYGGSGRFLYFGKEMEGTVTYTNPQGISGSYCLDLATYLINAWSYIKIYTREGSQGTKTLLQDVPFDKTTSVFQWFTHSQTVQMSSSTQIVIDASGTIGSYSSASMDNIQLNAGPC